MLNAHCAKIMLGTTAIVGRKKLCKIKCLKEDWKIGIPDEKNIYLFYFFVKIIGRPKNYSLQHLCVQQQFQGLN